MSRLSPLVVVVASLAAACPLPPLQGVAPSCTSDAECVAGSFCDLERAPARCVSRGANDDAGAGVVDGGSPIVDGGSQIVDGGAPDGDGGVGSLDAGADAGDVDGGGESDAGVDERGDGGVPWHDPAYDYRRRVTLTTGGLVEDLVDFPLLVRISTAAFDTSAMDPQGHDLRFVNDDGLLFAHEIERFSTGEGGVLWVKLPLVTADADDAGFWIYWGTDGALDAEDPAAVFSDSFAAVYHLDSALVDATGNGPAGTLSGTPTVTAAMFGQGVVLDGSEHVHLQQSPSVLGTLTSFTLEAWVRTTQAGAWHGILSARNGGENDFSAGNFVMQTRDGSFGLEAQELWPDNSFDAADYPIDDNQWHYAVIRVEQGVVMQAFADGELQATQPIATRTFSDQDNLQIGRRYFGGYARDGFVGVIDEVRVSSVARSASWIRAQYMSVMGTLTTLGPVEQR